VIVIHVRTVCTANVTVLTIRLRFSVHFGSFEKKISESLVNYIIGMF